MFLTTNKDARECRFHAEHCEDKARLQADPRLRQDFVEMQQRWLSLARSYEFLDRLQLLSAVEAKIKDMRLIRLSCSWHTACSLRHNN